MTGVNFLVGELGSKQLELLHELVPAAVRVGLLVNPRIPQTEPVTRDVAAAASPSGCRSTLLRRSDSREIEAAFGTLVRNRADALVVSGRSVLHQPACPARLLAARHAVPAIYGYARVCRPAAS